MIIAIDGPAGAGKSTIARAVARELGYDYIDSGAMYRGVALRALRAGLALTDNDAVGALARELRFHFRGALPIQRLWVDDEDVEDAIRAPEVSDGASQVAALPAVRQALVAEQRRLAAAAAPQRGVVMEGRDIGTVVFPEAELKVYLDASLAERARRRMADLEARGDAASATQVRLEVAARDRRDRTRALSPLRRAPDAVSVLTDGMPAAQVAARVLALARERQP